MRDCSVKADDGIRPFMPLFYRFPPVPLLSLRETERRLGNR
jgi:hypothetical protein